MKNGFYTALATPYDESGKLCEDSYRAEIDAQIKAGAAGLLSMGTMGLLGCVPDSEYENIIATACDAVAGRTRLLVGAYDTSLARVRVKMERVNRYPVDAVVFSAPFYEAPSLKEVIPYFIRSAAMTDKDVYIYDHTPTTGISLTLSAVLELSKVSNIKGIKSYDLKLIRNLYESGELRKDFLPIFSGSDLFAFANIYGIKNYMDGIFCCFPKTIGRVQACFDSGDQTGAREGLRDMMLGRDEMLDKGLWPIFSYAMNLLGCEGNFAPDYIERADDAQKAIAKSILSGLGEI